MSPFYDYQCKNGHETESLRSYDTLRIDCPVCGFQAERLFHPWGQTLITESGSLNGRRAGVPGDAKRYDVSLFQEACAERDHAHSKAEERAQRPLPADNLWGKAKKRADRILKGQEPAVTAQTRFKSRTV